MNANEDKVMTLADAVRKFVKDGAHISIGGFTLNRNPMAAVYEMIRQGIKQLHLYAHSNGTAVDELVGAGCVSKLGIASTGKWTVVVSASTQGLTGAASEWIGAWTGAGVICRAGTIKDRVADANPLPLASGS